MPSSSEKVFAVYNNKEEFYISKVLNWGYGGGTKSWAYLYGHYWPEEAEERARRVLSDADHGPIRARTCVELIDVFALKKSSVDLNQHQLDKLLSIIQEMLEIGLKGKPIFSSQEAWDWADKLDDLRKEVENSHRDAAAS